MFNGDGAAAFKLLLRRTVEGTVIFGTKGCTKFPFSRQRTAAQW